LHGSAATGEGLGDGVWLAAADALGEVDELLLVLPQAQSTTIASKALKRIRGNIAARPSVFAYSPPWPES